MFLKLKSINSFGKFWLTEESKTVKILNGFDHYLFHIQNQFSNLYSWNKIRNFRSLLYFILRKTSIIWLWFSINVWFENSLSDRFKTSLLVPSPVTEKLVLFKSKLSLSCVLAMMLNCSLEVAVFISIVTDLIPLSGSKLHQNYYNQY